MAACCVPRHRRLAEISVILSFYFEALLLWVRPRRAACMLLEHHDLHCSDELMWGQQQRWCTIVRFVPIFFLPGTVRHCDHVWRRGRGGCAYSGRYDLAGTRVPNDCLQHTRVPCEQHAARSRTLPDEFRGWFPRQFSREGANISRAMRQRRFFQRNFILICFLHPMYYLGPFFFLSPS